MTDAALIRRSRRDASAFDELFVRHAAEVRHYFRCRVDSNATALELTGEVFAQAWMSRRRFRAPADASAGPWLQGIAANLYRQWARHRRLEAEASRRMGIEVVDLGVDDIDDRLDAERAGPELRDRLHTLPTEQREAVELRVLEELPYEEVARRMESSVALARMRVSRALRAIERALDREVTG